MREDEFLVRRKGGEASVPSNYDGMWYIVWRKYPTDGTYWGRYLWPDGKWRQSARTHWGHAYYATHEEAEATLRNCKAEHCEQSRVIA